MSPEQEDTVRRDMRIKLPKAVGRHESARAYANTDKFSPQHMQARSKRSDFMGPRANLKSRGHEGGPNVAGASKNYQIDRRMDRTQRGRPRCRQRPREGLQMLGQACGDGHQLAEEGQKVLRCVAWRALPQLLFLVRSFCLQQVQESVRECKDVSGRLPDRLQAV